MRFGAQLVSVILHPLVMPTFGMLCYFTLFPVIAQLHDVNLFLIIFMRVVACTLLLPLMSVLLMIRIGKVTTVFIEDKRERSWPLLLGAAIYLATYYFLLPVPPVPVFISLFILGAAATLILALLINLFWKISLHMIGIGGLCGGLTAIFYFMQEGNPLWLTTWFVLAGMLGTARLILNAHTPMQVLAGFALGFSVEFGLALMVTF